jgi:transglutaminase superfamily protein
VLSVGQKLFRIGWWTANVLLLVSMIALAYSAAWEHSVRRYLSGFSDAIVPAGATPEERVEAILSWMRVGPPRLEGSTPTGLAIRDPENTLNYRQLLSVCGTATNAFMNLARSSDVRVRRLLLLTPDRNTKHVVAEVLLSGRWVVVDPTYRVILRNGAGEMVTLSELKNPQTFAEVIGRVPGYPAEYNYRNYAHVRVARLPMQGLQLRPLLDRILPGWDEKLDWSLLLERESFFVLTMSAWATLILFVLRLIMGWYADRKLRIPRFHLRASLTRARAAFLTSPEIK